MMINLPAAYGYDCSGGVSVYADYYENGPVGGYYSLAAYADVEGIETSGCPIKARADNHSPSTILREVDNYATDSSESYAFYWPDDSSADGDYYGVAAGWYDSGYTVYGGSDTSSSLTVHFHRTYWQQGTNMMNGCFYNTTNCTSGTAVCSGSSYYPGFNPNCDPLKVNYISINGVCEPGLASIDSGGAGGICY